MRGLEDQWEPGLDPWRLTREGDRWYGRGSADNKGQHVINLSALEAVLAERGGKLGFNVKLIIETGEESGSKGLSEIVAANKEKLAADVLLASDGPRVNSAVPTLSTGTRGSFHFDLIVDVRPGGVHSGNWGGMTTDPAIVLAHAIASIADRQGKILVRDWVPQADRQLGPRRAARLRAGRRRRGRHHRPRLGRARPHRRPRRSTPGPASSCSRCSPAARRTRSTPSPRTPSPTARSATRSTSTPTRFEPALRRHLDAHGFPEVQIRPYGIRMPARRSDPANPWVRWAASSMERTLGKRVQVIPNSGGGLPNDVFMDHLGVQLLWVPHSYNGCKQHGPNEHLLVAPAREGIAAFAGLWWDLGEGGTARREWWARQGLNL